MFVRSTGLGRTLLTGRIARVVATNIVPATLEPPTNGTKEPMRMLMEMEILNPVHWTVRAFLDPPDLTGNDKEGHYQSGTDFQWHQVSLHERSEI